MAATKQYSASMEKHATVRCFLELQESGLRLRYIMNALVEVKSVTPQTRGSVDYPSTRGIQVDVGLPDATSENRAESPLYGELYPNTSPA